MSVFSYLQEHHREALGCYIDEGAHIAVAVLDEQGRVVCSNGQFDRLTGREKAEGAHISDFSDVDPSVVLPPEGQSWNTTLRLAGSGGNSKDYPAHVVEGGGEYILFCDTAPSDGRPMARLSRLNQELSDLNRELEKKNKALQKANKTIEWMARTDSLTQLANRRHFRERAEKILSAAERHGFPVSVGLGDLDHFKKINDTYGHDTGDKVLKIFADVLRGSCRTEDLATRWGGEEFVVLMPYTAAEGGRRLTDRVRRKLAEKTLSRMDFSVTVSFGVAEYGGVAEDAEELVARADDALYRAKEQGRNCVVVADAPSN